MVEIKCPACGAAGRAPKAKIETRLICRKCLKVFHVTASGRTVLGEPLSTGPAATAVAPRTAVRDRAQRVDQWFESASRMLFSPLSLSLAVGLILLAVVAALFSPRRTETLQDRVGRAAKAAVQGDLQAIRELAATGTAGDAITWYITIRPQCDQMLLHLGSRKLTVDTEVKYQDPAEQSAEVVAQVSMEEVLERKGNVLPDPSIVSTLAGPPVSLSMAWKSDGRAGWKLDGTRTLALLKAAP